MKHPRTPAGRGARTREDGFTLVEIMFGLVALAIAATAIMQGVAMSTLAVGQAEDSAIAVEYARSLAERIAATPIEKVYTIWGPGGSEGPTFEVESLDGKTAGKGRIRIVTDETSTNPEFRAAFGLPRDLDGDGAMVSTDVSASARVLPVIVEVNWGRREHQRITLPVIVVR